MRCAMLLGTVCFVSSLMAQDTRHVTEPVVPPACTVLSAQLVSTGDNLREADEQKLDSPRIQKALDHCGQGKAVVLQADGAKNAFLSGPLELRDGVALVVAKGVTMYASRDPKLYDVQPGGCGVSGPAVRGCKPLIGIHDVKNAAVMGPGTIDGRGSSVVLGKSYTWWQQSRAAEPTNTRYSAPKLITADHADGLVLYGIRLHNAPNYHVTVSHTNGFTAWGVHLLTPTVRGTDARNTDGIDPSFSENITIAKSWIDNGDDNIAIKASVHHMSVLDNHFYSGHGMSIGSEARDEQDILVDTLTLDHTTSGVRIKSNVQRGGMVRGLMYRNLCMRDVASPLSISPFYTGQTRDSIDDNGMTGTMTPDYKGITLENVVSLTPGVAQFGGLNTDHLTEVTLNGVYIAGIRQEQMLARFATIHVGPLGTNLHFAGTGVTMPSPVPPYKGTLTCKDKFVPYQE